MTFCGNFFAPAQVTDMVEASKDAKKIIWLVLKLCFAG